MKSLLVVSLIFYSTTIIAQDSIQKKIKWGLFISAQKTGKVLVTDKGSDTWVSSNRFKYEKHNFSYNVGIQFFYKFNKHLLVETGLKYSSYSYRRHVPKNSPELPSLSGNDELFTKFNYDFIEVPLLIRYNINMNKFKIYSGLGVLSHILINKSIIGDSDNDFFSIINVKLIETNYNLFSLSAVGKLGTSYKVSSNFSVYIETNFNLMLSPYKSQTYSSRTGNVIEGELISKENIIILHEKLYSFGLSIGIMFNL
ncbi:MAG: outer membrane beta-barrel protein [Bacteroidales bacterium]|nr:outer membrane beta-barrel protein [Bacteroidales bacterium]